MLHNLSSRSRDQVWVTYDIDFIPATSPAAKTHQARDPIWMDVQNGERLPGVRRRSRAAGTNGEYTYPDDATNPYNGRPAKNEWTVDRTTACCSRPPATCTPAGCTTTCGCSAPARPADRPREAGSSDTAHLFSSVAHY